MATIKGKWLFNSSIDLKMISQTVNFTSNGESFTSFHADASALAYMSTRIQFAYMSSSHGGKGWVSTNYRHVDFGSDTQTVSDEFYTWFTSNVKPDVTNLSDTTWYIPAGWSATAGYGIFRFDYSILETNQEGDLFAIGYGSYIPTPDETGMRPFPGDNFILGDMYSGICFGSSDSFTLKITDGYDVSNSDLISWLSQYGELQEVEEETPTTPTKKFTRLYIGDVVASSGGKRFRKLTEEEPEAPIVGTEGLAYTLSDDGTYYICSGIGSATDTDIVIANTYNGLPVGSIGTYAFSDCTNLASVVIPDSITIIGDYAFYECTSLANVVMSRSVIDIGKWSFNYCTSLTSIVIPKSATIIRYSAFFFCENLTIYCEAETQPDGWDANWKSSSIPVVWGYTSSSLVSFTIDGTTYQAEEGMTWQEWLSSEYNTDAFFLVQTLAGTRWVSAGRVDGSSSSHYFVVYNDVEVLDEDLIETDRAYAISVGDIQGGSN